MATGTYNGDNQSYKSFLLENSLMLVIFFILNNKNPFLIKKNKKKMLHIMSLYTVIFYLCHLHPLQLGEGISLSADMLIL